MNAPTSPCSDLVRILAEIDESLSSRRGRLGPERLVDPAQLSEALEFDLLGVGYAPWRLARAQRELVRLHRRELARLLREAARLKLGAEGRLAPRPALEREAWRSAFGEELACAAADGGRAGATLHALLASLRSADPARWPAASELARAALALHPSGVGRACLGEAWLLEDRAREATRVLAQALSRPLRPKLSARVLALLVRAQAHLGETERARRLAACA